MAAGLDGPALLIVVLRVGGGVAQPRMAPASIAAACALLTPIWLFSSSTSFWLVRPFVAKYAER